MNHDKISEDIKKLAQEKYGLVLINKDKDPFFSKAQNLMFWNKSIKNTTFILGNKIYFPEWILETPSMLWPVLSHEMVHRQDNQRIGFVKFSLGYLFPQVLSVFSLFSFLGFFSLHFLWFLLFLLFLAPIPAPFRKWAEMRGYAASMLAEHEKGHIPSFDFYEGTFTSSTYYFMWPFKEKVKKELLQNYEEIKTGKIKERIPVLQEVEEIIRKHSN